MRVLIHDFGAYAFPVTLSQALQDRGYDVGHAYCNSLVTTPHNVCEGSGGFTLLPVQTSRPLNKYNLVQRWIQEQEYGRLATRVILNFNPDVVISANAPLSAQERILRSCKQNDIPFVFWLQDLIGLATSRVLKSKLPLLSSAIGCYFQLLEGRLLRKSDAVISITEDFIPALRKFGVVPDCCHVIENWGTLGRFEGNPSTWARKNDLNQRPILLYAGTLSMKHNPATLQHLAQQLGSRAQIVVVSQGAGADWLTKAIAEHNLNNLTVLPYQEADQLPAMYASAQLLLVLLTEDAGQFSVPSKVLTCLCAGRPILAAIPRENLAARIIENSGAGFIMDPNDHIGFAQKAQLLLDEPELCQTIGESAQKWADDQFEIGKIADQFEHVLKQASA
ncbi:MAG: glycosyltransferase family 4 protein [Bacteroidota bacterium]|nr:glycosyltransferase family 4 protein [Bacteroidota bacterium]MXW13947.1 glycosyltransferase family 4 protein [Rhodothermaceae bacterium]MDE2644376.1 glycosyltransferase family 4 protein [Bacteroidota bacterium]MXW31873.1 glycosyltransferase family 4 protein [Rhodothermaceae bacterium]MYC04961.1 glycosyltransferase family 4 protein [Rhodothermaceae bacterium]